nr:sulfotransferase [Rhizomicrobium palustre]
MKRTLGESLAALSAYDEALKRGASKPEEIHLNRGVIFADDLRRDDEAESAYTAALLINPRYTPALLNLANLKEDQGKRDEARRLYGDALAIEPNNALALARLAGVSKTSDAQDPLIQRLKSTLARPTLTVEDRSDLGFALGRLLDQCGNYDEAFQAYAKANRAAREMTPPQQRYNRAAHEKLISKIIAAFTNPVEKTGAPAPIFICGMYRSGSTLAEQVLAAHPRLTAGGELNLIPALVQGKLAPFPESMATQSPAMLAQYAEEYRAQTAALFPPALQITDKRPDNFLYIGLIKAMFPDAKIVHTKRNLFDTAISVYFQHLGEDYSRDLSDISHYIRQYQRLMAHWKSLYTDDVLDFDYDGFVREPRPHLEALLAFLGLDWHEGCLSFHEAETSVKTASVWQVREPLYQKSSGRWRAYEKHIGALKAGLQK